MKISNPTNIIYVDTNASDRIILSGTSMTDGYKIGSQGNNGNYVTLYCDSVNGWTTLDMSGVWIDAGA